MRRRIVMIFITLLFTLYSAMPSFAANHTVSSVTVNICPDTSAIQPGEVLDAVEPAITSGKARVQSYVVSETRPRLLAYFYEIVLVPEDGYSFSNTLNISVKGASKVELLIGTEQEARIRVTTYPVFRLENVSGIEESGDGYEWGKVKNARKYNVITYYDNQDGEEKKKTSTVKNHSIEYGDSFLDKNTITAISVQAVGDNDPGFRYVIPADYVFDDEGIDNEKLVDPAKFSLPSASVKYAKENTATAQGAVSSDDTGWVTGARGTWFRNPDGSWPANRWMYIKDAWYFFNADGYLVRNQWIPWNGLWYCVDKNGKMYADCWTPDGFYVDGNGAWVNETVGMN